MATKKSLSDKSANFEFEPALNELNQLVEKLEQGGLSLEQSLQDFERGIMLTRECQKALSEAEQKVQILMEKNGKPVFEDYLSEQDATE